MDWLFNPLERGLLIVRVQRGIQKVVPLVVSLGETSSLNQPAVFRQHPKETPMYGLKGS
jgi:hypothetical protein